MKGLPLAIRHGFLFTSVRPTSLKAANAGVDLSPISIHSLMEPGKHACLPVTKILEHHLCTKDTARHWITKMKRHRGMFLNSLGKKADRGAIINKEMMALLEVWPKEVQEREHLGNVKRRWHCGRVWQGTSWGSMFQMEGNMMQTQHDHGWSEMNEAQWNVLLDLILGEGKRERNAQVIHALNFLL